MVSLESLQLFTGPSPQAQYTYLDPEDTSASFPPSFPRSPWGRGHSHSQWTFAQSLK